MKLLGWMHRKLKQNSYNEAGNNRTTWQNRFGNNNNNDDDDEKYYNAGDGHRIYEEEGKELNEMFDGFLAIGTLGCEALFNTEPPTPTFPTTDHETTQNITDQDLKMITKELEKFLEEEEEGSEDVDAQSSKWSSYASIITLSGKQTVLEEDNNNNSIVDFPLQKYLFGSSIEEAVKKKVEEEQDVKVKGKCGRDKQKRGGRGQFAKNLVMKMLKNLNNSKSKTHGKASANAGSTQSISVKKKFPKVLKMFKKKVHPEKFIDEKESEKRVILKNGGDLRSKSDIGNIRFHRLEEELINRCSEEYVESGRGGGFMEMNNEHWIKTDADYLVLEL